MAFTISIVTACLAFVCCGWWRAVAGVHACLGVVILMLVVRQPVMDLFRPQPGAPSGCSLGWVRWAVAMSAWIMAVATVLPRGGCRLLVVDERTLGLPAPGGACRH